MRHLKIGHKLLIAFAIIIVVVLAMSGAVSAGLSSVRSATTANETSHAIIAAADDALSALVEKQSAIRGYAATGEVVFLPPMKGFQRRFETAMEQLANLDTDPAAMAAVADLRDEAAVVKAQQDQIIAMVQNPATAAQARAALPTVGRLIKVRATLKTITDPQLSLIAARGAAQDESMRVAAFTLAGGCVVSVLAALAMCWMLAAPSPGRSRP